MNYVITVLIFCEDCLSFKDFCSYLYLPWPHEGSAYFVVLTQLSEDLTRLGCISPCIVPFSARREQKVKRNGWVVPSTKFTGKSGLAMLIFALWPVALMSAQPNFSFELFSTTSYLRQPLCLLRSWGQSLFSLKTQKLMQPYLQLR